MLESPQRFNEHEHIDKDRAFVLLPHTLTQNKLPVVDSMDIEPTLISELWLERCMQQRTLMTLDDYPLGGHIQDSRSNETSKLVINATGFQGIEILHIAKIVCLSGAKYEEVFSPSTSVLVCRSINVNQQKLRHAKQWNVPVVSEQWLWAFIKEGRVPSVQRYRIDGDTKFNGRESARSNLNMAREREQPDATETHTRTQGVDDKVRDMAPPKWQAQPQVKTSASVRTGSDFLVHDDKSELVREMQLKSNQPTRQKPEEETRDHDFEDGNDIPLREISPNPPTRNHIAAGKIKKQLFKSFDGTSSIPENELGKSNTPQSNAENDSEQKDTPLAEIAKNASSINGAIRDLLNTKSKGKTTISDQPVKKKLLGRALSNLSNASAGSDVRASRASSIDSMNTDGLGSEIVPSLSNRSHQDSAPLLGRQNSTFTSRAQQPTAFLQDTTSDIGEPELYQQAQAEEDKTPELTQLVYEDPEEAIALQEQLAERRRQKSKLGQKESDPKPMRKQEIRRLRDDDLLVSADWGTGRRTRMRQKDKTPPGLKQF